MNKKKKTINLEEEETFKPEAIKPTLGSSRGYYQAPPFFESEVPEDAEQKDQSLHSGPDEGPKDKYS